MEGFLPFSRGSFSLDLIALAMFFVTPILTYSIYLVRSKKHYQSHKKIQIVLSLSLLFIVLLFEIEIRVFGWTQYAKFSPFYDSLLFSVLYFHVAIATTTLVLWVITMVKALRSFPKPAKPGPYSKNHRIIARWAAFFMYTTSITGWLFYWMAFIA